MISPQTKAINSDIASSQRLIYEYRDTLQNIVKSMALLDASVSHISIQIPSLNGMVSCLPSNFDAIRYQLDEFQRKVVNLQSNLWNIQNMNTQADSFITTMARLEADVREKYLALSDSIREMQSIVSDLDEIAKNPAINRTIEELREVVGIVK